MDAPQPQQLAVRPAATFDLSPQNFEQAITFAQYLSDSDMVPKDFKGKPANCLIAVQWGAEVGMKPLQSIQNIAVINGRPSMWGDALMALVRSSPLCEWVKESDDGFKASCTVKRRGEPEQTVTFSMDDAKLAGLLGKQGPWTQYPKRMRQMRARAFALRDVFPDVLRGMQVMEETQDMVDMGPAQVVGAPAPAPAAPPAAERTELPPYPQETLDANLETWRGLVLAGRITPDALIVKAGSKGVVSEAQKTQIRNLVPIENGAPATATTTPTAASQTDPDTGELPWADN